MQALFSQREKDITEFFFHFGYHTYLFRLASVYRLASMSRLLVRERERRNRETRGYFCLSTFSPTNQPREIIVIQINDSSRCPVQVMSFKSILSASKSQKSGQPRVCSKETLWIDVFLGQYNPTYLRGPLELSKCYVQLHRFSSLRMIILIVILYCCYRPILRYCKSMFLQFFFESRVAHDDHAHACECVPHVKVNITGYVPQAQPLTHYSLFCGQLQTPSYAPSHQLNMFN